MCVAFSQPQKIKYLGRLPQGCPIGPVGSLSKQNLLCVRLKVLGKF